MEMRYFLHQICETRELTKQRGELVIGYATPAYRAFNAAYSTLSAVLKSPPFPPFLLLVVGPGIN